MKTKKGEKEKLRGKILEAAIQHFKVQGRTGSATEALMKGADLTKGALYSHFESKDNLFMLAVLRDLDLLHEKIERRIKQEGSSALKNMIEAHLSEQTLDNIGESCVLSSLSSDMNRCKTQVRKKFAERMDALYEQFAEALKFHFPDTSHAKRVDMAQVLYASLVGAVSTARIQTDREVALSVLKANRKALLKIYTSIT